MSTDRCRGEVGTGRTNHHEASRLIQIARNGGVVGDFLLLTGHADLLGDVQGRAHEGR